MLLLCGRTEEACSMVNSLRKVDFSHPSDHYTWKNFAPPPLRKSWVHPWSFALHWLPLLHVWPLFIFLGCSFYRRKYTEKRHSCHYEHSNTCLILLPKVTMTCCDSSSTVCQTPSSSRKRTSKCPRKVQNKTALSCWKGAKMCALWNNLRTFVNSEPF